MCPLEEVEKRSKPPVIIFLVKNWRFWKRPTRPEKQKNKKRVVRFMFLLFIPRHSILVPNSRYREKKNLAADSLISARKKQMIGRG